MGIIITQCLVRPVSKATFAVNAAEGQFRFNHARVREYSEAIAFYEGHDVRAAAWGCKSRTPPRAHNYPLVRQDERARTDASFAGIYKQQHRQFRWETLLTLFSATQSTAAVLAGFVVINFVIAAHGDRLEGGAVTTATVNSAVSTFQLLTISLNSLTALYSQLGVLAGLTHRLGQFMEGLDQLEVAQQRLDAPGRQGSIEESTDSVRCVNLTLRLPSGITHVQQQQQQRGWVGGMCRRLTHKLANYRRSSVSQA